MGVPCPDDDPRGNKRQPQNRDGACEDWDTHTQRETPRVRGERGVLDLDVERALGGVRRRARTRSVAVNRELTRQSDMALKSIR